MPSAVLAALFFLSALLYASVGHAGASAYLAAMALFGCHRRSPGQQRLTLNILVASFVTFRFWRAGLVSFRALAPFVTGSIPLAFIGGSIDVPTNVYKLLLGIVLIVAASDLRRSARNVSDEARRHARCPRYLPSL